MREVHLDIIQDKLNDIKKDKMHLLYKGDKSTSKMSYQYDSSFVSYTSKIVELDEQTTNYVARNIIDDLRNIKKLKRMNDGSNLKYNMNHNVKKAKEKYQNTRFEEWICYDLVDQSQDGTLSNSIKSHLGDFFDYQIPLKCSAKDPCGSIKGVGKIDLVSLKEDTVYLIEVKKPGAPDTLLRCILEIETYYRQLDKNSFLMDYSKYFESKLKSPGNLDVKKAVLIFENSQAYIESISEDYKDVQDLMKQLEIELFIIPESGMKIDYEIK